MAMVLAHHNLLLVTIDRLLPLFRDIFSDSKVAKEFSAARTMTTCILNMTLHSHFEKSLVPVMKQSPFSLATDGSQ